MPASNAPLVITSDEINCLIYAYLEDSGFQHASFSLRSEARLDQSPHHKTCIRRGELVDLLTKALLYTEVEAHWKQDSRGCTAPFSLLAQHECKTNAGLPIPMVPPPPRQEILPPPPTTNGAEKRKASHSMADERSEKRARTQEPDNSMVVDIKHAEEIPPSIPSAAVEPLYSQLEKQAVALLAGHKGEVFSSAWHPLRPEILATGSKDANALIWSVPQNNMQEYQRLFTLHHTLDETVPDFIPLPTPLEGQHDITSLDWSPDGNMLATGSYDSVVRVWTSSGKELFMSREQKDPIFTVKFSANGLWLLTCSLDGTAVVYDMKAMTMKQLFKFHTACCLDIDWLDNENFASCGADGRIFICTLGDPNPTRTFDGHQDEVNQIRFTASGHLLASCSDDRTAVVWWLGPKVRWKPDQEPSWDPTKQGRLWTLQGHTKEVSSCRWCPEGGLSDGERLLATTSFDYTARLWDARTGGCLKLFDDHRSQVFALDFHPSGDYFATVSADGYMYVYSIETREMVCKWKDSSGAKIGLYEVEWHPTGKKIAMCLASGNVAIVDVDKLIQSMALRKEVDM